MHTAPAHAEAAAPLPLVAEINSHAEKEQTLSSPPEVVLVTAPPAVSFSEPVPGAAAAISHPPETAKVETVTIPAPVIEPVIVASAISEPASAPVEPVTIEQTPAAVVLPKQGDLLAASHHPTLPPVSSHAEAFELASVPASAPLADEKKDEPGA
ncbi:MAG: hypothetical protein WDW36_005880 [Sanguina aurantia]